MVASGPEIFGSRAVKGCVEGGLVDAGELASLVADRDDFMTKSVVGDGGVRSDGLAEVAFSSFIHVNVEVCPSIQFVPVLVVILVTFDVSAFNLDG